MVNITYYAKRTFNDIKNFVFAILGVTRKIHLEPLSDIEKMNSGFWKSTGNDPAFIFKGKLFNGWIEIKWNSEAEESIPLKFYWDDGNGFSEERSTTPSFIPSGEHVGSVYLYIPYNTLQLRLDPGEKKVVFLLENVQIKKVTRFHLLINVLVKYIPHINMKQIKKGFLFLKRNGLKSVWKKAKNKIGLTDNLDEYSIWKKNNEMQFNVTGILAEIDTFSYKPLISIILPVYNVEDVWLEKCIESVINQIYPNWQLCIADDASTKPYIQEILNGYEKKDKRIKVVFREVNGHISEASNSALDLATGEFIALLDHDDELSSDALYEVVKLLNNYPDTDMIYSDEDFIDVYGNRQSPFFKPAWSPERFMTHMYTCHFGVYRNTLVKRVGGFRKGFEGSQDFDLVLRLTEVTNNIQHIPKILYHWRMIPESTASNSNAKSYTHIAGLKALEEAIERRNINGWIEELDRYPNYYRLHYHVQGYPVVSIVVIVRADTTKGQLEKCINSLYTNTNYKKYEIIVVYIEGDGEQKNSLNEKWSKVLGDRIKVVYNQSKLKDPLFINKTITEYTNGEHILFLNSEMEVVQSNWLNDMIGHSQRADVAAIGSYITYPDNSIDHSGLVLGLGKEKVAGDGYKHNCADDPGHFGALFVVRNVSAVTINCLMVSKNIFYEVGGFDENLERTYYDVDFCLKARKSGYNNIWLPYVNLVNHGNKEVEGTPSMYKNDVIYMKNKWGDTLTKDPYYNQNYSLDKGYSLKL